MKTLDTPIQYLKGIGPKKAQVFARLGIETIEDLIYHFPYRYEDRSQFIPISKLEEGKTQTIKATVLASGERKSWKRRRFSILKAAFGDETGKIFCVWFNQPYLKDYFKPGQEVILYGRVERYEKQLQINSPEFEIIEQEDDSLNSGRIVPIYSLTEGFTQRYLRKIIKQSLDEYIPAVKDFLPYSIRNENKFPNLAKALRDIHFPEEDFARENAFNRLCFEEFFQYVMLMALRKINSKQKQGIQFSINAELIDNFVGKLGFELTESQKNVIEEIKKDMQSNRPMQRLLQGDVGSGKTVVAIISALIAIDNGYQVSFMAPTEILAKQHYENVKCQMSNVKLALLTSSLKKKEKDKIYKEIKHGKVDLIIGTHSLIQEDLRFKKLGLVIIDEQHKFGVGQRAILSRKASKTISYDEADLLILTATPIPRTLALTLYADLDISTLKELPAGRKNIETTWLKSSEIEIAWEAVRAELKKGRQGFVVYPIIEESRLLYLKAAETMYKELKNILKEFKLGLIHGRVETEQQDKVMQDFKTGKINLLVGTGIIEVGIDIPNATILVIEHAERFGLAQLHQLRGRVGRGPEQSYCILVADVKTENAAKRLKVISSTNDGFRIAEEDLNIRGQGEFFGLRQHGSCEFKIANPIAQIELLQLANKEARGIVDADPKLIQRQNIIIKEGIKKRYAGYERFVMVA